MAETIDIRIQPGEYYDGIPGAEGFLKASARCDIESFPLYQRRALSLIDDEILEKFHGCGSPIPPAIDGCTVLNLGCGTGRDAYLASQLVGPQGYVIGVDMTEEQFEEYLSAQLADPESYVIGVDTSEEQLAMARKHVDSQMARFGYLRPNVDFRQGYLEDLAACGIADNSIDLVISNCGLNLSPNKERVFAEVFRVLKPGGEFYFADVFSGRRIPDDLRNDPVLYTECFGGALYLEDFRRMLRRLGCLDFRVISKTRLLPENPDSAAKAETIDFYSMTIRIFKLASLEDVREDYGQSAVYLGTIPEMPDRFLLDDHHLFIAGKPMPVCGNSAAMIGETRFARHFQVNGDSSLHFGSFALASENLCP